MDQHAGAELTPPVLHELRDRVELIRVVEEVLLLSHADQVVLDDALARLFVRFAVKSIFRTGEAGLESSSTHRTDNAWEPLPSCSSLLCRTRNVEPALWRQQQPLRGAALMSPA